MCASLVPSISDDGTCKHPTMERKTWMVFETWNWTPSTSYSTCFNLKLARNLQKLRIPAGGIKGAYPTVNSKNIPLTIAMAKLSVPNQSRSSEPPSLYTIIAKPFMPNFNPVPTWIPYFLATVETSDSRASNSHCSTPDSCYSSYCISSAVKSNRDHVMSRKVISYWASKIPISLCGTESLKLSNAL